MAAHGLIDQGAADPNQGQLFAPHELPQAETAKALALKAGVAPPLLGSRPGFMPEVYERTQGGPHISTPEAHKIMKAGINRTTGFDLPGPSAGDAVKAQIAAATHLAPGKWSEDAIADIDRPRNGPIAQMMHERRLTASLAPREGTNWYATVRQRSTTPADNPNQGRLEIDEGTATKMIASAARGTGTNYPQMARATAITSPRTAWTMGTPGTDDYEQPNVDSARNVVHDTLEAKAVSEQLDIPVDYHEIGMTAKGETPGQHKAKAAVDLATKEPTDPIHIAEIQSQKVPNFNQSLNLANPSQAVRRQAALSYTPDSHDARSTGKDEDILKTPGGIGVVKMTGRRSSLAESELAPMYQSKVWMGRKSLDPEPLGRTSMLEKTRGGKIRPRPEQVPGHIAPDQFAGRSPTAERLGLEF